MCDFFLINVLFLGFNAIFALDELFYFFKQTKTLTMKKLTLSQTDTAVKALDQKSLNAIKGGLSDPPPYPSGRPK